MDNVEKIIFQGKTKKGLDVLIRYPKQEDAEAMCDYINTLSAEKTFILFQGEQMTLEKEQEYLDGQLEKIKENKSTILLVFNQDKLIGISNIEQKDKAEKHIGNFGISVAKNFRGEGVGSLLMELVMKESINNFNNLKIIVLSIFGDNNIAQSMYKKNGFEEYGNLPGGILHADIPVDHIYMYRKVDRS